MSSHSKTTNSIRNMIHNSTSSFAQFNLNSTRNRILTPKPPKKTNCDVNLYKYPGRKIFETSEINEKALSVIGSGTITVIENYSANNVSAEVAHLITKLLQSNSEVSMNTENVFGAVTFFRRVGKKRKFCKHVASDNFQYDAHGLKAISTKDSKSLYIILNQPFSSQADLTHRQSTSASIPTDIDFDDDTFNITDNFEVNSSSSNYHREREEVIVLVFSIDFLIVQFELTYTHYLYIFQ